MIKKFIIYYVVVFISTYAVMFIFFRIEIPELNFGTHFHTTDIVDKEGHSVALWDFLDKELNVVDYWFYSCEPCLKEMVTFPDKLKKNKQLGITSISIDKQPIWLKAIEDGALFDEHENWNHYNYIKGNQRGEWANMNGFPIRSCPTYFLLDKEGKILNVTTRYDEIFRTSKTPLSRILYEVYVTIRNPLSHAVPCIITVILLFVDFIGRMVYKRVKT